MRVASLRSHEAPPYQQAWAGLQLKPKAPSPSKLGPRLQLKPKFKANRGKPKTYFYHKPGLGLKPPPMGKPKRLQIPSQPTTPTGSFLQPHSLETLLCWWKVHWRCLTYRERHSFFRYVSNGHAWESMESGMDAWRGVEREKVVRDMWCGVEREGR